MRGARAGPPDTDARPALDVQVVRAVTRHGRGLLAAAAPAGAAPAPVPDVAPGRRDAGAVGDVGPRLGDGLDDAVSEVARRDVPAYGVAVTPVRPIRVPPRRVADAHAAGARRVDAQPVPLVPGGHEAAARPVAGAVVAEPAPGPADDATPDATARRVAPAPTTRRRPAAAAAGRGWRGPVAATT